ncbi:MAG: hypothetical protein IJT52_00570 [Spirochaetales bacterium]|nr:hypothetical protein [Spirochaetales bacterium]
MKKFIIIALLAAVACTSVFASDGLSLGFSQSWFDTSLIADYQWKHFGVEGSVGLPLVQGIAGTIDYIAHDGKDEDGNPKEYNILEMFLLPSMMVNGYWKAIDGDVFDLRLGLQGDAMSIMRKDAFTVVGLAGISIGLDFQFNEKFSMNLSGSAPLALLLQPISEDVARYTVLAYSTKEEGSWDFLMILPTIYNAFARLSFKWSV